MTERVLLLEPGEGDVYLAEGEGPQAAAIHMDVIRALFDIVNASPDLAEHLFELIIRLALELERKRSISV